MKTIRLYSFIRRRNSMEWLIGTNIDWVLTLKKSYADDYAPWIRSQNSVFKGSITAIQVMCLEIYLSQKPREFLGNRVTCLLFRTTFCQIIDCFCIFKMHNPLINKKGHRFLRIFILQGFLVTFSVFLNVYINTQ